MSAKTENLKYSSILPEKRKNAAKRDKVADPLKPSESARRKRGRVGRGRSAGQGKTCGRGQKGQKSRAGSSTRPGFEGGQMPLHRRMPKRGFTNIFKKEYQLVNVMNITRAGLSGTVAPEDMKKAGLIRHADRPVKVLGLGEIPSGLNISADAFSGSCKAKIEAAGGSCTVREKTQASGGKEKRQDKAD